MPRQIPNAGTYQARVTQGQSIVVYETEHNALCLAIPVTLLNSEVAWSGKATVTIAKSSGEIQTRRVEEMKTIFGWDGADPFWLEDIEQGTLDEIVFEIVGDQEEYTPPGETESKTIFKIQWVNPLGGSAGAKMPEKVDRKQALAKWGSKFKAVSGGSKPAATPKLSTAKPAQAGPPGRKCTAATARTSTQEEVWTALRKANPASVSDDELADKYYAAQDEVAPNAEGNLTIQQWGAVADKLGV
jgi:hypothetical protein